MLFSGMKKIKTLNAFGLIQALQLASRCIQAYQTCSAHTGCIEYQITIRSQWLFPVPLYLHVLRGKLLHTYSLPRRCEDARCVRLSEVTI